MSNELERLIRSIQSLQEETHINNLSRRTLYRRLCYLLDDTFDQDFLDDAPRFYRYQSAESIHHHLDSLERKIEALAHSGRKCAWGAKDLTEHFPQFLTALSDVKAKSDGYANFSNHFEDWFTEKTAVIVDPYIFSNGNEEENFYCNTVIKLIGEHPERIDFYFSREGYKKSVADKIFNGLSALKPRLFNFFECKNIHDRVWMKHHETKDDSPKKYWKARVVGASVNGIAIRPTYVIAMPDEDTPNYSTYLSNVRNDVGTLHTSTPP